MNFTHMKKELDEFVKLHGYSGQLSVDRFLSVTGKPWISESLLSPPEIGRDIQFHESLYQYEKEGAELLASGKIAIVLLCGGLTRDACAMGECTVHPYVSNVQTFLEKRYDVAGLGSSVWKYGGFGTRSICDDKTFATNPLGELLKDSFNKLVLLPSGHGSALEVMSNSEFFNAVPLVEHVYFTNCTNTSSIVDPMIVGFHARSRAQATYEVVNARRDDRGGRIAWYDNNLTVIDESVAPPMLTDTNYAAYPYNTNSVLISKSAFKFGSSLPWHIRRRTVGGKIALTRERALGDISALVDSKYVLVDRFERYNKVSH